MEQEIHIERPMRVAQITSTVFVAIGFLAAIVFGWFTFANPRTGQPSTIVLGGLCFVACCWKIFTLSSSKPLIETSGDGLFAGGNINCYIPWENIQNISAEQIETRTSSFFVQSQVQGHLRIDVKNPSEIYYDSTLSRFTHRFSRERNAIVLFAPVAGNNSQSAICDSLRERWKRAVENKVADDSKAVTDHNGIEKYG